MIKSKPREVKKDPKVIGITVTTQRRYDIRAPSCAFHVIKIILNVQFYMGAWAWNVKIMT